MAKDGPFEPFETRFIVAPPPETNAQEAAVRVYSDGVNLKRSDPFVKPADRFGNAFKPTEWSDTKPSQGADSSADGSADSVGTPDQG
mmetsp:Transcript_46941/g.82755  ORF Transcript_46941/g.82755 Transcript_46941/m.82755 type:complete len:87 (+) Transcript_46941:52-312(+)